MLARIWPGSVFFWPVSIPSVRVPFLWLRFFLDTFGVYTSDVTSLGSDSRTRRLDPIFGDSKRLRLDFLMVRLNIGSIKIYSSLFSKFGDSKTNLEAQTGIKLILLQMSKLLQDLARLGLDFSRLDSARTRLFWTRYIPSLYRLSYIASFYFCTAFQSKNNHLHVLCNMLFRNS